MIFEVGGFLGENLSPPFLRSLKGFILSGKVFSLPL